jgi:hypothetical protein
MIWYGDVSEDELKILIPLMMDNLFDTWIDKPSFTIVKNLNEIGLAVNCENCNLYTDNEDLAMNLAIAFILGYRSKNVD